MKNNNTFYLLLLLLSNFILFAQKDPELSIALLANDKIADVNVNQEKFLKSIGEITDLKKKSFQNLLKIKKLLF